MFPSFGQNPLPSCLGFEKLSCSYMEINYLDASTHCSSWVQSQGNEKIRVWMSQDEGREVEITRCMKTTPSLWGRRAADGDSPTTDTIEGRDQGQVLREKEALNVGVREKTQFRDTNWDQLESSLLSSLTIFLAVSLNNYCFITDGIKISQKEVVAVGLLYMLSCCPQRQEAGDRWFEGEQEEAFGARNNGKLYWC